MKIKTSRFGTIEVAEEEFIYIKGAILGFERLTRFVLLIRDDRNPLWWLQAVDDPAVAFVVVNPRLIKRDYDPPVYESELEFLDIRDKDDIALLAIVTIRSNPFRVTANLRAPLLINAANRMGNQIVLEEPAYHVQFDILDHRQELQEMGSEEGKGLERLAKQTCAAPA
ncbi:MAG TPA: flagellar assembly protein FliW [Syntrophales bacterium]|jgi:flagellar assembly factor FliW|nr:flagellar assembly protein FliW [Syntrophales bacterium]HON24174.1 flagellar assembly protein FliW [Syntrophales bacterium]HOU78781.1 flagellar assembly protein FliW [Syntrophales bacterium]HPC33095.1 flagellar assembly protein FliW [Syntrophales bacterium]HRR46108.1 flagellar assembly protein FliW [Syntrophales bacterium]